MTKDETEWLDHETIMEIRKRCKKGLVPDENIKRAYLYNWGDIDKAVECLDHGIYPSNYDIFAEMFRRINKLEKALDQ